ICFTGNVKKRLQDQGMFPVARIRFNKEHMMDCSLEARHVVTDDANNTLCGFAFVTISAMAQRYLDRLITEFQWEERHMKELQEDRKSTRLNSSHVKISYAVFCLKKKKKKQSHTESDT